MTTQLPAASISHPAPWWRRRRYAMPLLIMAGFLLLREAGIVNLNFYQSRAGSSFHSSKFERHDEPLNLADLEYSIWPIPLDYLPLYKSRSFTGVAQIGSHGPEHPQSDRSYLRVEYSVDLTVTGFCSGHQFRALAHQQIQEFALKQAADDG